MVIVLMLIIGTKVEEMVVTYEERTQCVHTAYLKLLDGFQE